MEEKIYIPSNAIKYHSHIKMRVDYDKGDWRTPRGYYLRITAVLRTDGLECFSSDSPNLCFLLDLAQRKNPKRYNEFVAKMNKNAEQIANLFATKEYEKILQIVKN